MRAQDIVFFLGALLSLTFVGVLVIGSLIGLGGAIKAGMQAVQFRRPGWAELAGVAAVCLGVALAGDGIAERARDFRQASVKATAAANSGLPAAAGPLAMGEAPGFAASPDRVESPRECALDKGITEACTFN